MIAASKREIVAVFAIWAALMVAAAAALLFLNFNALRIINHIEYETGNRFSKALVLYTEAKKHGDAALRKSGDGVSAAGTTTPLSYADKDVSASLALLSRAFVMDPRNRFAPERELYWRLQGEMHGLAGGGQAQLISYARACLSRKDLQAASQNSQRTLSAQAQDPEARLLSAEIQYASGQRDIATSSLLELTQSADAPIEALELLGRIFVENKQYPQAIAQLKQAISRREFAMDLRKQLALLQLGQGMKDDALTTLREGMASGGEHDGNYLHIYGEALRTQPDRVDESVELLERAAELEPNSGDVLLSLARAYESAGSKRLAAAALQRAIAIKPDLQKEVLTP